MYNILGKEVFSAAFEGTGMNDIQLPNIKEGIYIINLTYKGTINKKVIIQINPTKDNNKPEISRKEALKKIGNYGKYTALTALGTYMI